MTLIYSLTIFVSAFLLFLVQPMVSKLILPHMGGSPAVWNTAMMCFQAMLLLGYVYVYLSGRLLSARKQFLLHIALLGMAFLWLPLTLHTGGVGDVERPIEWVTSTLLRSVGPVFLMLAASAPLLQYWLSRTTHKYAANPYFLYSASNVGSLIALLCYPFVIEPLFTLPQQTYSWSVLFVVFALSMAACGWMMRKHYKSPLPQEATISTAPAPTRSNRIVWVALAFFPSSLMLGVTTYITTDIASMPLLWIVPLLLYLLTFILAFARTPIGVQAAFKAQIILVPLLTLAFLFSANSSWMMRGEWLMVLHLLAFFVIALGCHGTLAQSKPDARYLTEFFVWVSLGGVLGGIFNSLAAPFIFTGPIEYMIVFMLALFMRSENIDPSRRKALLDLLIPVVVALSLWVLFSKLLPQDKVSDPLLIAALAVALIATAYCCRFRPIRFALIIFTTVFTISVARPIADESGKKLMYSERNFFGLNRLYTQQIPPSVKLVHGTTVHGLQATDPKLRLQPVSYYGTLRELFNLQGSSDEPVAVIGLGAGTLACFGHPHQQFDFYEIDPAVAKIARNPEFFTYLRDCPPKYDIIMGDGRLMLQNADKKYGIVVIDAFSSDAVPMHLLTREALAIYLSKLQENGLLMFNISNRHLHFESVMAALAKDAGLTAMFKINIEKPNQLATSSKWVVMARHKETFAHLVQQDKQWRLLEAKESHSIWTDNYSNILQVLRKPR